MAALAGCGIDNAVAEIDGPELPIIDGSAAPFVFLIDCAGTVEQDAPRREIEILRTVRVTEGEAFAELRPGGPGLRHGVVDRLPRRRDRPAGVLAAADARQLPPRDSPTPAPSPARRTSSSCAMPASPGAAAWRTPWWWTAPAC